MSTPTRSIPAATASSAIITRSAAASSRRWARTGGRRSLVRHLVSLLAASLAALVALVTYHAQQFDAADLPVESYSVPDSIPNHDAHLLPSLQRLAEGLLQGPEDFAYDRASHTLYTGCLDGWIRRVRLGDDGVVEAVGKWAYVGGRPLGVALAPDSGGQRLRLYVANANRGLQMVADDTTGTSSPRVTVLADEAEGLRFALANGVDVAPDGAVYYTDSSWKYPQAEQMAEILEGRPNGRLLRYDPRSNSTGVLVDGIYFANGVAVEPNGEFVVFCETLMRRCFRYYVAGAKQGQRDVFVDNLPGFPDNIRYDGSGSFWIALPSGKNWVWDALLQYRWVRKLAFVANNYVLIPGLMGNAGVLEVGLDGRPLTLRSDPKLPLFTGAFRVGDHLYLGTLMGNYIGRIRLGRSPNTPV